MSDARSRQERREAEAVAAWLSGVARADAAETGTLPDPSGIWWRAQIERRVARRRDRVRRAVRPILVAERLAAAAGAGGIGLWTWIYRDSVGGWMATIEPALALGTWGPAFILAAVAISTAAAAVGIRNLREI